MYYASTRLARKKKRVVEKLRGAFLKTPCLFVFRSNRYIYAQIVFQGKTIAASSSLEKNLLPSGISSSGRDAASCVGRSVAERALEKGVARIVFCRGPYAYHGRVACLADAARKSGLEF